MKYPGIFSPIVVILIILSLLGSLMIYYSTTWGPWAFSDSTESIVSARNLLAGKGLGLLSPSGNFKPLSLHPPFYALILSGIGLTGINLIVAARWLNIFLFAATIFISGTFTYKLVHSNWAALSTSLTLLVMPPLVDISSGAMTELLFIFLAILGIFLLTIYLEQPKIYFLILTSVIMGMAFLTRLNGVVLMFIGLAAILFTDRISWMRRLANALLYSLLSMTPMVMWLTRAYSRTGALAGRNYHFSTNFWKELQGFRLQFMQILWSWLPYQHLLPTYSHNLSRNIFIALTLLILLLLGLLTYKRYFSKNTVLTSRSGFKFLLFWIFFGVGNLLLLIASYLNTNLQPSIDDRTLLPIQVAMVFIILTSLLLIIRAYHLPAVTGWVCAGLVLIMNLSYANTSLKTISQWHISGFGYTSKHWQTSLTLQKVRNFPDDVPIITNEASALLLLVDRPAYDFCELPCDQNGSLRYGDSESDVVQSIFREDGAALVLFYPFCILDDPSWYSVTLEQYATLTQNLTQYFSSCDGAIYFYPSNQQY